MKQHTFRSRPHNVSIRKRDFYIVDELFMRWSTLTNLNLSKTIIPRWISHESFQSLWANMHKNWCCDFDSSIFNIILLYLVMLYVNVMFPPAPFFFFITFNIRARYLIYCALFYYIYNIKEIPWPFYYSFSESQYITRFFHFL